MSKYVNLFFLIRHFYTIYGIFTRFYMIFAQFYMIFNTILRNLCDFNAIFCQAQTFCCQAPKTNLQSSDDCGILPPQSTHTQVTETEKLHQATCLKMDHASDQRPRLHFILLLVILKWFPLREELLCQMFPKGWNWQNWFDPPSPLILQKKSCQCQHLGTFGQAIPSLI